MAVSVTYKLKEGDVPHPKAVFSAMFVAGGVATEVLAQLHRNRKEISKPARAGLFLADFVAGSVRSTGRNSLTNLGLEPKELKVMETTEGLIYVGSGIAHIVNGAKNGSNKQIVIGTLKVASGSARLGSVLERIASEQGRADAFTITPDPEKIRQRFYSMTDAVRERTDALREYAGKLKRA